MLGITDLPTYLVGLALIVLLPGPNSLYVVSVAARRGVRPGYQAACGVFCGDAVLMTLSAGGVASLLQASPLAFSVVKYLGAGYLSWLAVGLLRARGSCGGAARSRRSPARTPGRTPGAPNRPRQVRGPAARRVNSRSAGRCWPVC